MEIPKQLQDPGFRFLRLKVKDKLPLDQNWQTPGLRFDDPLLIQHLERGGNYGIIGGYGRLRLLDIDDVNLVQQVAKVLKTFSVQTGKGGRHFYILSEYDQNHVLGGGRGELRANMQYVVGPGSIHPNGQEYQIVHKLPFLEISGEGLSNLLEPFFRMTKVDYGKVLKGEIEPGARNDGYFRAACLMRFQRIPKDQCLSILTTANNNNISPLAQRELARCVDNAYGYREKAEPEKIMDKVFSAKTLIEKGIPDIEWYTRDVVPKGGITFFGGTSGAFKSWNAMELSIALATGTHFMEEFNCPERCRVLYVDEENGNVTIPNRLNKLVNGRLADKETLDNLFFSIFNSFRLDNIESIQQFNELMLQIRPDVVIIDSMVRAMAGEEDKAKDVKEIFVTLKPYLEQGISFVILHHTVKNDIKSMAGLRGSGDFSAFADVVIMFSSGKEGFFNCNIVKNRHIEITDICNFYGYLNNIDDETVKIEYKGVHDEKGNVIEQCADAIIEWIEAEKITSFTSGECKQKMKSNGQNHNRVFSALRFLTEKKTLIRLKRGKYKPNPDQILTVEEELI